MDATSPRLGYLRALEAESIHIFREVASEFQRPVMLYSIGKDSSVMLRLAQKAFFPGPMPFPLLHVDTGYKFHEMIDFRDRYTSELGLRLIVHRNEEAIAGGAHPSKIGTQRCCGLLKTQALLDGLRAGRFDAAFGGARRDEEKSRAKERIYSTAPGTLESVQQPHRARREYSRISALELDGNRYLAIYPSGKYPNCSAVFRQAASCGCARGIHYFV
jgi:sulfate adenylyltransferase small subunit